MPVKEIEELKNQFVNHLAPIRVYLFGSFAYGNYTDESDLDFYIVVADGETDLVALTTEAYRSIRSIKKRPVDIIVGTKSRFEKRKVIPSVENEVYKKGVLIYGAGDEEMA